MKDLENVGFNSDIDELIIAEKTQQGEKIAEALGFTESSVNGIRFFHDDKKNRVIVCAIGHLYRCLLDRKFQSKSQIQPNTHLKFRLNPKNKLRNSVISHFKNAKQVVIATDYDQEGQNIAGIISEYTLKKDLDSLLRMKFSSLESSELSKSYDNPITFDKNLYSSGQTRMKLDSLYGLNLSKWFMVNYTKQAKEIIRDIYKREGICDQRLSNGRKKEEVCQKILFHSGTQEIFILDLDIEDEVNLLFKKLIDEHNSTKDDSKLKLKMNKKGFIGIIGEIYPLIEERLNEIFHYIKEGRKEEEWKLDEDYTLEDYMKDTGLTTIPRHKKIKLVKNGNEGHISRIFWSFEHNEERCELCQLKQEFGWNPLTKRWDDYTCPNHLFYRVSLSVGRVQSPTASYIVNRYLKDLKKLSAPPNITSEKIYTLNRKLSFKLREIDLTYNPKDSYLLKDGYFFPKLERYGTATLPINQFGLAIIKEIQDEEEYIDLGIPNLMNQTDCTQYINERLKLEPDRIERILERLYLSAFLSYPRTDSQKLPKTSKEVEKILLSLRNLGYDTTLPLNKLKNYAILEIVNLFSSLSGKNQFKRITAFKEGDKTDEAHPCIHPITIESSDFDDLKSNNPSGFLILDLIIKRFLLSFENMTITRNQVIRFNIQTDICKECGFDDEKLNKYSCKGDFNSMIGEHYDDFLDDREHFREEVLPNIEIEEKDDFFIMKGDYYCEECGDREPFLKTLVHTRTYKIREIGFGKYSDADSWNSRIDNKNTTLKVGDKFIVDIIEDYTGQETHSGNFHQYKQPTQMDIINWMSDNELGTKSTRSTIIRIIKDRAYITDVLTPTSLGIELMNIIEKYSKTLADIDLTIKMEEELEKIRRGEKVFNSVLRDVESNLEKIYGELYENEEAITETLTHYARCKNHKCPMLIKDYPSGKLLECPYKFIDKCRETIPLTNI